MAAVEQAELQRINLALKGVYSVISNPFDQFAIGRRNHGWQCACFLTLGTGRGIAATAFTSSRLVRFAFEFLTFLLQRCIELELGNLAIHIETLSRFRCLADRFIGVECAGVVKATAPPA